MNNIEIRRTLELFKPSVILDNGEIYHRIIEIRVIDGKKIYSGYYTLPYIDKLIKDISPFDSANIYFVLNEIKGDCYSKKQRNKLLLGEENTKDTEIEFRTFILIDLDPRRVSKVSATDSEKKYSEAKANQIYQYLSQQGFERPIVADSANGVHLLYSVAMECNEENDKMITDFLNYIAYKFSDDYVDVDIKVGNRARITKLYGTKGCKGADTPDRPHRESKLVKVPQQIRVTPTVVVKKIADLLPKPEKPSYENNYGLDKFNIEAFIEKHNIKIAKDSKCADGRKYLLDTCPFCGNKAPDSALFQRDSGAVGFFCFHNSCADKKWRDFRLFYEPDAYNKNNSFSFKTPYRKDNNFKQNYQDTPQRNEITDEKGKLWLDFKDIEEDDRSGIVSIPSGFKNIDSNVYGFDKKNLIVWSGSNGSGKSSVLNQICLNAINCGFKGRIWSGELNAPRLKKWIYMQAAGKQNTRQSNFNEKDYYVINSVKPQIDNWLYGNLKNYNTKYSNNIKVIIDEIRKEYQNEPFDFLVIDNLMVLDIAIFAGDKNDKQTQAFWDLHNLAEELNIVIHIVAHPKKPNGFITKYDISGTGNIGNTVDAIYIVHRINRYFDKTAPEYLSTTDINDISMSNASNIIICEKHREFGYFEGSITKLFYQQEDKRFLNEQYEHWEYSWNDNQIAPSDLPILPNIDFENDNDNYNPFEDNDFPF